MTVRELLDRIDSRELTEWIAYWSLEPFGQETYYAAESDPPEKQEQSQEDMKLAAMRWSGVTTAKFNKENHG